MSERRRKKVSWPDVGTEQSVLAWCVRFRPTKAELAQLVDASWIDAEALTSAVESMLAVETVDEAEMTAPLRVLMEHVQRVGRAIVLPPPFPRRARGRSRELMAP